MILRCASLTISKRNNAIYDKHHNLKNKVN
jgi:hypothetical protein